MNGRRVFPDPEYAHWLPAPGEYGKHPFNNEWVATTPNGHFAALRKHAVTEHNDGTISVAPSILVSNNAGPLWHGFLERGIWREA